MTEEQTTFPSPAFEFVDPDGIPIYVDGKPIQSSRFTVAVIMFQFWYNDQEKRGLYPSRRFGPIRWTELPRHCSVFFRGHMTDVTVEDLVELRNALISSFYPFNFNDLAIRLKVPYEMQRLH